MGKPNKTINKNIKIFMDARLMFYAGVGRYQREFLLNVFKNHDENNSNKLFKPVFYLLGDKNEIKNFIRSNGLLEENFFIINSKAKKYSFKEQFFLFFIFLKYRKKVDLFFFPHYNISIFYIPKNSVVTVHDLTFYRFPNYTGRLKTYVGKLVLKRVLKKTKKIITVSNYVKQDIINMFENTKGIDLQNKIKVIYHGYSLFFKQKQLFDINDINHNHKDKDKLELYKPYILYLGNRKKHKNIQSIIKAYKIIKEDREFKNLKLILIGSKFEKYDFIDDLIEKENIMDIFQFSNLSDEEIKLYYENASVFTFFSIGEGFGYAPLEAAACGAPLILANAGALPEVFKDAAIFVDPFNIEEMANAIKKVLKDERLRNELKKKSLNLTQKYSYQKMAKEMLNYFKSASNRK